MMFAAVLVTMPSVTMAGSPSLDCAAETGLGSCCAASPRLKEAGTFAWHCWNAAGFPAYF